MKNLISFLFIFLPLSGFGNSEIDNLPEVKAIIAGLPNDLKSFISRTVACNHWSGEEPYDKERAEFIRKAVEKAECSKLEKDEDSLRSKYKANKKFNEAIQKSKDIAI